MSLTDLCPCCEGEIECLPECTFFKDAPEQYEDFVYVRGLRAELDRLRRANEKLETQRDAMFHEVEALRSKTPPCIDCDRLRREREETARAGRDVLAEADYFLETGSAEAKTRLRCALRNLIPLLRDPDAKEQGDG